MMIYIDGFVAAVPTANRDKFRKHAEEAAATFREYGALSVTECWGDDVLEGKITSFLMAVQRKDDETVVFSWTVWPSKPRLGQAALLLNPDNVSSGKALKETANVAQALQIELVPLYARGPSDFEQAFQVRDGPEGWRDLRARRHDADGERQGVCGLNN
jgi:uncharacterized protein YbaA (DUF1428 family)